MKNDLVSIITPSYRSQRFISQTINSVLAQNYENWEMIIVDDVSPDNANEIIEKYTKKDNRIKLIELEKNSGPAVARNRAIEEAQGRYIAFLDADDLWMPQKLEIQVNFLKEHNLSLTYSSYYTIDENNNYLNTRNVKEKITYEDMLKSNHIGNLTGIYDCQKIGKHYMTDASHEDYILWLTIMKDVKYTKGITEPLAKYRIFSDSLSSNKIKSLIWAWNIYRNILKLNIFKSSFYLLNYIYFSLTKRV